MTDITHPNVALPEALYAYLSGVSFALAIEWDDPLVPELDNETLTDNKIRGLIVPRRLTTEWSARRSLREEPAVDIGIRARAKATDKERIRALLNLANSVALNVLGRREFVGFSPAGRDIDLLYDVALLRKSSEFRGVQTLRFRGNQSLPSS